MTNPTGQSARKNPTSNSTANGFTTQMPHCPVADRCGACQYINQPYTQQLSSKDNRVATLFAPLLQANHGDGATIRPIMGMENPYHYRNKVVSPFAPGRKLSSDANERRNATRHAHRGTRSDKNVSRATLQQPRREILCGMYAAHSHRIVATDNCLVENEQAKAVVLAVRKLMMRHGMEPYDERTCTGFIRHVQVRVGHTSGEVLVTLVINGQDFPAAKSFCRELVRCCPFITSIVQNVNQDNTNVILGDKEQCLYGPGFILDRLCDLSFRISSRSFYQVNSVQTERLYREVLKLADLRGNETVVDAYCGTGTIALVAAKNGAKRVFGVDTVNSAIDDARENARHNGIENATFSVADAGEYLLNLADSKEPVDVLLMDPPRAGANESFLRAAALLAPRRIVYVSCNPQTQVRDLAQLQAFGYMLQAVQPVDMFPHTSHIETIALLVEESCDSMRSSAAYISQPKSQKIAYTVGSASITSKTSG